MMKHLLSYLAGFWLLFPASFASADITTNLSVAGGGSIILENIYGSGANLSYVVIDWRNGSTPVAYGYRWTGTATGEDMFRAVVAGTVADATDEDLFLETVHFAGFGNAVTAVGYDRDHDGFDISDPDDDYQVGFQNDFWGYYNAPVNPYAAGNSWAFADSGMTSRALTDGAWDGWRFGAFDMSLGPAAPELAAVPEPGTMGLMALAAVIGVVMTFCRRRRIRAAATES